MFSSFLSVHLSLSNNRGFLITNDQKRCFCMSTDIVISIVRVHGLLIVLNKSKVAVMTPQWPH